MTAFGATQPSRDEHPRAAGGCNAWFWCKESAGCWEPQSGEAVGFRECILLGVAMQPQPLPPPGPPSRDEFSSFAAGYLVDEGQPASHHLKHTICILNILKMRCCCCLPPRKLHITLARHQVCAALRLGPPACSHAFLTRRDSCAQSTGICGMARARGT